MRSSWSSRIDFNIRENPPARVGGPDRRAAHAGRPCDPCGVTPCSEGTPREFHDEAADLRPAAFDAASGILSLMKQKDRRALLLGVGLDNDDGHKRITRGRDTLLVGGSKETHQAMQEKVVRFQEELDRRGMRLADVRCAEELKEIADRSGM